jgi:hypothetical protein
VLPNSFSAVPRAALCVFMFCVPGLIFGGTGRVRSRFHVLRSRTHFRRYRGSCVPFSCFVLPDSLLAMPSASGPVFIFCALGLVYGDTDGVGYLIQVLHSRTHFTPVPGASGPIFLFGAPGLVFGNTKGVGSRFLVLRSRTRFQRYRGRRVPFSYFAPRTRFLRFHGRRVLCSCFARPNTFLVVPRASGPVFMFCTPVLVFSST